MAVNSFSIKFYPNKIKISGDKYKVYCRVTINRKKSEFATGLEADENQWNAETGRYKKDSINNDEISDIENRLRHFSGQLWTKRFISNHPNVCLPAIFKNINFKVTFLFCIFVIILQYN